MGAGSVYSTESFLSSLGVPPPDKPVRVGLVRCDRSVPPEAQAKYDYVYKARQGYQLGPHELNWTIMDLDDDPVRPLYQKSKDTHFATAQQARGKGTRCLGSGPLKHQHRCRCRRGHRLLSSA